MYICYKALLCHACVVGSEQQKKATTIGLCISMFLLSVQTSRAADGGVSCCQRELPANNMEGTDVRPSESTLNKRLQSCYRHVKRLKLINGVMYNLC